MDIYVDGACTGNGTTKSKAGIGIFFGDNHPLNLSKELDGTNLTNNIAELNAVLYALKLCKDNNIKNATIYTDSRYVHMTITKWLQKWKDNCSRPNIHLILEVDKLYKELLSTGFNIQLKHVKGHSKIYGNEKADQLAKICLKVIN